MKKIYLEITNNCNLNCSFCLKNNRSKQNMTFDNFKIILDKINNHTKYLYFHVYGEPLIHPNINEFIDYASNNFKINITTNGYLINRIINNKNIRQINISLHSYNPKYKVSLEDYMNNILHAVNKLKEYTYISYRIWINNEYTNDIINILSNYYNVDLINKNIKLENNVYFDVDEEFLWPNLDNELNTTKGTCYAIRDHIAILVDGTIVPCCLDTRGIINLGNIYNSNLEDILNSKRVVDMLKGFKDNKKIEKLCQKCNFIK